MSSRMRQTDANRNMVDVFLVPKVVVMRNISGGLSILNGRYELQTDSRCALGLLWRSVFPLNSMAYDKPMAFAWLVRDKKGDWILGTGGVLEPPTGQPATVMLRSDSAEYLMPTLVESFVSLARNGFFVPSSARCDEEATGRIIQPHTPKVDVAEPESWPIDPSSLRQPRGSQLLPELTNALINEAFREFTNEMVSNGYFPGLEPSSFSTFRLPPEHVQECETLAQQLVPEAAADGRASTVLSWRPCLPPVPTRHVLRTVLGQALSWAGWVEARRGTKEAEGEDWAEGEIGDATARRTRRFTLPTNADGNCLLNAASLALWGVNALGRYPDSAKRTNSAGERVVREPLRVLLHSLMNSPAFRTESFPRFQAEETRAQSQIPSDFRVGAEGLADEWAGLTVDSLVLGRALTPLHVYALVQVLRRPIVVYERELEVDPHSNSSMAGIYLPLFFSDLARLSYLPTCRQPLTLLHSRPLQPGGQGHFTALVHLDSSAADRGGGGGGGGRNGGDRAGSLGSYLAPLVNHADGALLPVRFLRPGDEEPLALLERYLDVEWLPGGFPMARLEGAPWLLAEARVLRDGHAAFPEASFPSSQRPEGLGDFGAMGTGKDNGPKTNEALWHSLEKSCF